MTYSPRFLRINLSMGTAQEEEVPEDIALAFVGGRGFGIKYLYDELRPGIDPLGPENKLLLVAGPLAGTTAQSMARWMAVTKSPLTGAFCRSVGGADFAAWLKFAGYDFLIIEGRAEKPVYLLLEGNSFHILDASPLWGKDTMKTQEILKGKHGPSTRVACIGPAGENLVRYAGILSDRRIAGRGGTGAVMGAKKLKAVAIKTTRRVSLSDPEGFKDLVREQIESYKKSGLPYEEFCLLGTTTAVQTMNELGIYPVRNFRYGQLDGYEKIAAEEWEKITEKHVGCYSCMINCGKIRRVPSGPHAGVTNEGPEYESIWAFTGPTDSTDLGATLAADYLCDQWGLDTISTGNAIGFAYELFEKGILISKDTDGLELRYGDASAMLQLIEKIARREGLGDLLAEGVMRAAERIGKGAEDHAIHVKGMELPAYDPRGAKAHGLSYATANIGGSHNYGYAAQEIFGVPIPRPVDRLADEGKGDIAKFNQDFQATLELGIACTFPVSNGWMSLDLLGKLLASATGVASFASVGYLLGAGERVYNLERLFNLREGFTRKDDYLPIRILTQPLMGGRSQGEVVRKMDGLLDEYYQARGWTVDGIPTEEKLRQLGV